MVWFGVFCLWILNTYFRLAGIGMYHYSQWWSVVRRQRSRSRFAYIHCVPADVVVFFSFNFFILSLSCAFRMSYLFVTWILLHQHIFLHQQLFHLQRFIHQFRIYIAQKCHAQNSINFRTRNECLRDLMRLCSVIATLQTESQAPDAIELYCILLCIGAIYMQSPNAPGTDERDWICESTHCCQVHSKIYLIFTHSIALHFISQFWCQACSSIGVIFIANLFDSVAVNISRILHHCFGRCIV